MVETSTSEAIELFEAFLSAKERAQKSLADSYELCVYPYVEYLKAFCEQSQLKPIDALIRLKRYDMIVGNTIDLVAYELLACAVVEMMGC